MQTDYPDPQGLPELRAQICEYLARRRGISASADDVLIVNGTQQAFSLAADVLLDAGDRMLLEDPHYQGARQVFAARGGGTVPGFGGSGVRGAGRSDARSPISIALSMNVLVDAP